MKPADLKYARQKIKGLLLMAAAIILSFCPRYSFSQNIDNLNIEKVQDEGLTNGYINCIVQDKNGFIWVGTGEGVFRYDGYSFKAFRNLPGNPATLANNRVTALYTENDNLWVGTGSGLSCLNINTGILKNFTLAAPQQINAIFPKEDSVFWVATLTGLYQFNKNNYRSKLISAIGNNSVSYITDDKRGHLYVTASDGFYCYTLKTREFKFHPLVFLPTYPKRDKNTKLSIGKTAMDKGGNLWLSTWDAGLVKYNPKTGKTDTWFHPTDDVRFLPYKIVMDILPDTAGNIWLANKEGGLTIFNPAKNKFTNYPVDWKSETQISDPVLSLFRDRSGIVWIGTENGIFKYDPHHISLAKTNLFFKSGTGVLPAHISPLIMFKDRDGLWWLGMYEGVFTFDEKTGVITDRNAAVGLPKQFTYAAFNIVQDAKGIIWITAKNLLIKVIKKSNTAFKTEIYKSDDIKSTLYKLYIDGENRMWIGTRSDGIYRFDPVAKKFISCHYNVIGPYSKINGISAICELSKDSLLIGGSNTGLFLFHPNTGKYEKVTLPNANGMDADFSINSIYKNANDIWIGTENNGLWQTNTTFKKSFNETISDGLPSMSIELVTGDKHDNIWLLTNSGVVRFQIKEKKTTVFDKRDGIQNFALDAMIVDSSNNVLFSSRGVIYNLNPAKIVKNSTPPEVEITDMRIFDKDYTIHKGEAIELNYNQNYFSFEYVGLNYTQSRLNKYAYKMAGLDKKWNYAGTRRYVSYANLDEGTYTFYVKACNNEGVWNNTPAKFTLIIAPPFWHRWWFYASVILLIISGVYFIYWYNVNQLKIRVQLRNKIARDLHDDIGSTLSGINIFSKIALQKLNHNEKGSSELLEKISDRSEKTMDALSDIVWSISTKNDRIDNFLVKAREYMTETLEPQGIRYEIHADEDIGYLKLGMELRKEFYLIFKEAICNASKYAECTLIEIFLKKEKDMFLLTIRDNGKGFDINKIIPGNGLENMQHRAEKMNARLVIASRENQGTSITLSFHIPRFR